MKEILYHGYTVTGTASDCEGGFWRAHARISWEAQEFTLDDPMAFNSQGEAEDYAIEMGKHWVNNRLQGKMF